MASVAKEAGNALYTAGRFEEALGNYTRAVELESDGYVHYSNRSACYFSMGKFPEALQDAETCIRLKADWPRGYLRKGKALHELKRHSEAVTAFEAGLKLDPSSEPLQSALKISKSAQKSPLRDIFTPEKVARLRTHPKTAAYFSQPDFLQIVDRAQANSSDLGSLMLDPRVMACFQANMEMDLEGIQKNAFSGLSDILKNSPMGDLSGKMPMPNFQMPNRDIRPPGDLPGKEARKEPEPQPKAPPRNTKKEAEEAKAAGNKAYSSRQFPEALRLYDQAIALNPTEIVYYTNKAAVLFETGANEDCVRACEEGVRKGREAGAEDAKIVKALVRKANALKRLNRHKVALESLLEAQRLQNDPSLAAQIAELRALIPAEKPPAQSHSPPAQPYSPPAQPYSEPTSLAAKAEQCNAEGSAAFKKRLYSEAEQKYSEAIDLHRGEAKYWANRSAARIQEGNYAGALRDINTSLQLNGQVCKTWNRKGYISQQMGDMAEALKAYDAALGLNAEDADALEGFGVCARALVRAGEGWDAGLLAAEGVRAVLEERGSAGSQQTRDQFKRLLRLS